MVRIPLTSGRHNIISFPKDGIIYTFDIQWNNRVELYQADIYEAGVLVLAGVMLVSGIDMIQGLTGITLVNLYGLKIGFPQEEIGFDDMSTVGYVVTDEEWLIQTQDDAYYAALQESVYVPVGVVPASITIETMSGDVLHSMTMDIIQTVGKY